MFRYAPFSQQACLACGVVLNASQVNWTPRERGTNSPSGAWASRGQGDAGPVPPAQRVHMQPTRKLAQGWQRGWRRGRGFSRDPAGICPHAGGGGCNPHPQAPAGKARTLPPGMREGRGQQPPAAPGSPWGGMNMRDQTLAGRTEARTVSRTRLRK